MESLESISGGHYLDTKIGLEKEHKVFPLCSRWKGRKADIAGKLPEAVEKM